MSADAVAAPGELRRELRLTGLVIALLAAYGACVAAVAASVGQLRLLVLDGISQTIVAIWTTSLSCVFLAYALDLILRRRPDRPLQVMAQEARERILRPDRLVARATVVLGWFLLMLFFTPMKVMIGNVRGFPLDAAFAQADRLLFLGHDPWEVTHWLFGGPWATLVIQGAYNIWFGLMWLSIIYLVVNPYLPKLRAQYLIAFLLCWMVVGSGAAYLLASAGPCYYERAFGDPHFQPLMERLASIHADLGAHSPGLGLWSLQLQDRLWNSFVAKHELFGGGISAMPSMHVSVAVLMACAAWTRGRRAGWAMTVFALVIWIGSIHLGWHYALDGIVALPLTLGIWRLSGWLADRFVLAEPRGAARPAFA